MALHPGKESYEEELHQVSASDAPVLISLTFHDDMFAVMEEVAEHGHFENFLLNNFHRGLDLLEAFPVLEGAKGVAPVGQHAHLAVQQRCHRRPTPLRRRHLEIERRPRTFRCSALSGPGFC